MKSDVVDQLVESVYRQTPDKEIHPQYGFTRQEVELLIKAAVDRCLTVMEAEMDQAFEAGNAELYATLVDIAFKVVDEFSIDELDGWDEDELLRTIEGWDGQDDK